MKVIFHTDFYREYTSDPAAEPGRLEAIVSAIQGKVDFITPEPATLDQLRAAHSIDHIESVKLERVYDIAALAAGGAIQAGRIGLTEPAFALIGRRDIMPRTAPAGASAISTTWPLRLQP